MDKKDNDKPAIPPRTESRAKPVQLDKTPPTDPRPAPKTLAEEELSALLNNPVSHLSGERAAALRKYNAGAAGRSRDDDVQRKEEDEAEKARNKYIALMSGIMSDDAQEQIARLEREIAALQELRTSVEKRCRRAELAEIAARQEKENFEHQLNVTKKEINDLDRSEQQLNHIGASLENQQEAAKKELAEAAVDPDQTEDGNARYYTKDRKKIVDQFGNDLGIPEEEVRKILATPGEGGLKSFEAFKEAEEKNRILEKSREQVARAEQEVAERKEREKEKGKELEIKVTVATEKIDVAREEKNKGKKEIAEIETKIAEKEIKKEEVAKNAEKDAEKNPKNEKAEVISPAGQISASPLASSLQAKDNMAQNAFNPAAAGLPAATASPAPAQEQKRAITPASPSVSGNG